jgi:hypothetical protein
VEASPWMYAGVRAAPTLVLIEAARAHALDDR